MGGSGLIDAEEDGIVNFLGGNEVIDAAFCGGGVVVEVGGDAMLALAGFEGSHDGHTNGAGGAVEGVAAATGKVGVGTFEDIAAEAVGDCCEVFPCLAAEFPVGGKCAAVAVNENDGEVKPVEEWFEVVTVVGEHEEGTIRADIVLKDNASNL